jgi:hypothetical protein
VSPVGAAAVAFIATLVLVLGAILWIEGRL